MNPDSKDTAARLSKYCLSTIPYGVDHYEEPGAPEDQVQHLRAFAASLAASLSAFFRSRSLARSAARAAF